MTGSAGRQVQMMFDNMASALPPDQGRQAEGVCRNHAKARAGAELPTMAEAGVKDFDVFTWWGVFAPAGTSPEIVKRLSVEIGKALAAPDLRESGWPAAPNRPPARRKSSGPSSAGTAEIRPHREGKRRPGRLIPGVGDAAPALGCRRSARRGAGATLTAQILQSEISLLTAWQYPVKLMCPMKKMTGRLVFCSLFVIAALSAVAAASAVHAQGPNLLSQAALIVDARTGDPIFAKNANNVTPIASIPKLMTAMVVLDAQQNLDQT